MYRPILTTYDIVSDPSFRSANMRKTVSSDVIDFYVNRFQKNYNERGIFQMYYISNKLEVIRRLINIEKNIKNKEGFKLDVSILTDSRKVSENIIWELRPHFKYNLKNRSNIIESDELSIESLINSTYVHNCICGRDPSDLIFIISDYSLPIEFHSNLRPYLNMRRRTGSQMIKTIYLPSEKEWVDVLQKEDKYYYDTDFHWSDENYKMELRQSKLDRILKNN